MQTIPQDHIDRLDRLIGGARRACVISHAHPDGDAVGSALGLKHYLQSSRDLQTTFVVNDLWSPQLDFLFGVDTRRETFVYEQDPIAAVEAISGADLIFCTDLNMLSRAGEGIEQALLRSTAPRVVIDHHLYPESDSFELIFSETEISSASELLLQVLKQLPDVDGQVHRLPSLSTQAILTGITTDTNNFANSVFPTTLTSCSELLEAGVDRPYILDRLYNQFDERRVRGFGDILSRRMRITHGCLAYIVLDEQSYSDYGFAKGDTEGLVNIPLSIAQVQISMFLHQEGDVYRVSIRAKSGSSAYELAHRYFNGGGHALASGGRLPLSSELRSADDVEKYIIRCAEEYFK